MRSLLGFGWVVLAGCGGGGLGGVSVSESAGASEIWDGTKAGARVYEILRQAGSAMQLAVMAGCTNLEERQAALVAPGALRLYGAGIGKLQFKMPLEETVVMDAAALRVHVSGMIYQWVAEEERTIGDTIAATRRGALAELQQAGLLPAEWVALAATPFELARVM